MPLIFEYTKGDLIMENPKLFISYSWTSPEHEEWVLQLANELVENGVDVTLDKWNLKEGNDAYAFMEKMVSDQTIKKVLIICDEKYSEKANERSGGVGTETQIITSEIYEKEDQNKFVAIVKEKDSNGKPYLPVYYKSRIYIDLSEEDFYTKNFEQLLRWIFDKPLYIKPEIGKIPSFLSDSNNITLGTTFKFKRALDALRNGKSYTKGALSEYFDTFASNLEKFRIENYTSDYDDILIKNIEDFIPYRNEIIEIFYAISQYQNPLEAREVLHHFFELLIPYMFRPKNVTSWRKHDFDNFKFIFQELFLYCIACLLKRENFNIVSHLLNRRYYVQDNVDYGREPLRSFNIFRNYLDSLDYRNKKLGLRRLSLQADLLKQRCTGTAISFDHIMQADFILFIRDSINALKENSRQLWWPITCIYASEWMCPFEIFSRSESMEYFDQLKCIFNIDKKDDLIPLIEAFKENKLSTPHWDIYDVSPVILINYEKLASRS